MFCNRSDELWPVSIEKISIGCNCSFSDRLFFIRNDKFRVKVHSDTKTLAFRTCSKWTVKWEHPGLKFFIRNATYRTGHLWWIEMIISIFTGYNQKAVRSRDCLFTCFNQSRMIWYFDTVNYEIYIMHLVPFKVDFIIGSKDFTIHPDSCKPFFIEILEELLVGSFLFPDEGGKNGNLSSTFLFDPLCDSFWWLSDDGKVMFRTVGDTNPCIEETEIIIDLGNSPYCWTGVFWCRLLLDWDCRRKPFDGINIRLIH